VNEPVVDQRRIEANWRAITIELDAPRPSRLERALRRAGVPTPVTRMVAATPALRRAWYLSIVGVVLIGLGVADPTDRASLFALLVMAPLLPVLGVALEYGSAADPAHEIQVATPTHGLRLVAVRAATVLVVSVVAVVLFTLTNDAARPYTAVWLLPAVAVTTASLALMTVRPPRQAAAAVAVAWLVAVVVARTSADDPLAAFRAAGQLVAVAVIAAAVTVAVVRRERFERLEPAG
jgi:hypothetical protein